MSVGWTGVRNNVKPSRADEFWLLAERRQAVGASQCELEKRPIRGEPVKARDAWRIALKSVEQTRDPFRKVASIEIRGIGGWTLNDIRKTDPETGKLSIVIGAEAVGAERLPHVLAQLGCGECRPEPARGACEVVSSLNRVQTGIDSNEHKLEPWPEIVWQCPKRVSLFHPVCAVLFLFHHTIGLGGVRLMFRVVTATSPPNYRHKASQWELTNEPMLHVLPGSSANNGKTRSKWRARGDSNSRPSA